MLAGPHEFLADNPFLYGHHAKGEAKNSLPPPSEAAKALAAYRLLAFDAGWLSARSGRWLQEGGGGLPSGFELVEAAPVSRVLQSPLGPIGLVLFPEGPTPGKSPTPEQRALVLEAGRKLAPNCVLVIGISPWGYVGERDFLPEARGVFSCIFGGGEGVGFGFSVPEKSPDVLWLRPDSQGRAVNVLELFALPAKGAPWKEGQHFEAWLEFLDDSFRADPAMLNIVGQAPE